MIVSNNVGPSLSSVFCHVYVTMDSYLSVRTQVTVAAQDLIHTVAERFEYPEEDMVLVAATYPGGNHSFQGLDEPLSLGKNTFSTGN